MPISESISSTPLANGDTLYYGRQKMIIPTGGASVRQCSFFIPSVAIASPDDPGAKCTPVVVATVDNEGIGAGTIMGVYSVVVVQVDAITTEIAISAQKLAGGGPLGGDYFCNVTVIGTPM